MENAKLENVSGKWRLSYPLYVEMDSAPLRSGCSPGMVTMLEKSLKRLLFKHALLHCTDEFRHLIKKVLRCSQR